MPGTLGSVANTAPYLFASDVVAASAAFNGTNASGTIASNAISLSVAAPGAGGGIAAYDGANSITSGTMRFTNANGVTFSINGQTLSGSVVAQSLQTQMTGLSAGMSTLGNTGGTTGLVSNRLVFVGDANGIVTLSQSIDGQSATLSIGVTAIKAIWDQGSNSFVSGNVGFAAFVPVGNMSIVADTDFGTNMSFSVAERYKAITLGGNTAGTTTFNATNNNTMFWHGGNNITLSGSGSSITISGANAGGGGETLTRWCNMVPAAATSALVTTGSNNTLWLFPLTPVMDHFEADMTISTMLFRVSLGTTNTAVTKGWTMRVGIYTLANTTALSLLYLATSTFTVTNANHSASWLGDRVISFHSSQFSNSATVATTPSLAKGSRYWVGIVHSTANSSGINVTHYGQYFGRTAALSGTAGAASVGGTSRFWYPFMGVYSTANIPVAITRSSVNANNATAGFIPCMMFENELSQY